MTAVATLSTSFPKGAVVRVVRSCLPGDQHLVGKLGRVLGMSASGGVLVRFGSFWQRRVETCFPDELEAAE